MATIIATVALVVIVTWAVRHLWRSRQSGPACVGCPLAVACSSKGATCEGAVRPIGPTLLGMPIVRGER